ncbi:MAG: sortase [Microgenomates group bacterium]
MKNRIHHFKKNLTTPEYLKILILRTIGNFLLFSSLFMIAKTFYLPLREEIRYFIDKKIQKKYIIFETQNSKFKTQNLSQEVRPKGLLAKTLNIKQVEYLIPEDPNFSIVIPKIGANAKILPNIDASDEKIYLPALQKGVAQAAGTAFPGEGGHIFLFAHSTDYFWNVGAYNAVFYLLSKLEKGDEVNLFYQGKRYVYRVINKEIIDPSQVQYLTRKTNKEFLTLQTCWPPGTTLKRLLVFATRVVE